MARSKSNEVWRTDNYRMFKHLIGNRGINPQRINRVIESIREVGYIQCPVIVNENMEVIDGQARLRALERLGLPVDYIVVKGAGIEECISMNIKQSNWTMNDYIDCYAELGYESYKYLKILIEKYSPKIPVGAIVYSLTLTRQNGKGINGNIRNGKLTCTDKDFDRANKVLDYLTTFNDVFGSSMGRREYYYIAVAFCYMMNLVDKKAMIEKVHDRQVMLQKVATIQQAFESIESIYNYKSRSKVYIYTEYRKYCDEKMINARKEYLESNKANKTGGESDAVPTSKS